MSSIAAIALSGMKTAQSTLDATAHNIANVATEGFHREQASLSTQAGGGVSATFSQAAEAGAALEHDMVAQLQAKNAFLANLAVFKTSDRMMGALLKASS